MGFLTGSKIKIDPKLYAELSDAAGLAGYSSVDEMAEHILRRFIESEAGGDPSDEDRRLAEEQLKGLGYLK